MEWTRQERLSLPGTEHNEDIATIHGSSAWVLDGATGLNKRSLVHEHSDAKWFVEAWDRYLKANIDNRSLDLKTIVRNGIIEISAKFEDIIEEQTISAIDLPSSSFILIRWGETIEYFALGDCILMTKDGNGRIEVYKDYSVDALDDQVFSAMDNLMQSEHLTIHEAKERVMDLIISNRLLKNTEGGYWILGFDERAVDHCLYRIFEGDEVKEMLLMTDGFSAISDKYRYFQVADYFDQVKTKGLAAIGKLIRKIEADDPHGKKYPRFKQSDDTSAVYLQMK